MKFESVSATLAKISNGREKIHTWFKMFLYCLNLYGWTLKCLCTNALGLIICKKNTKTKICRTMIRMIWYCKFVVAKERQMTIDPITTIQDSLGTIIIILLIMAAGVTKIESFRLSKRKASSLLYFWILLLKEITIKARMIMVIPPKGSLSGMNFEFFTSKFI